MKCSNAASVSGGRVWLGEAATSEESEAEIHNHDRQYRSCTRNDEA